MRSSATAFACAARTESWTQGRNKPSGDSAQACDALGTELESHILEQACWTAQHRRVVFRPHDRTVYRAGRPWRFPVRPAHHERRPAEAGGHASTLGPGRSDSQPLHRRFQRLPDHVRRAIVECNHGTGRVLCECRPADTHPDTRLGHGCQHRHHGDCVDRVAARLQAEDRGLRPANHRPWLSAIATEVPAHEAPVRSHDRLRPVVLGTLVPQGCCAGLQVQPGRVRVCAELDRVRIRLDAPVRAVGNGADGGRAVVVRVHSHHTDDGRQGMDRPRPRSRDDPRRKHRHDHHGTARIDWSESGRPPRRHVPHAIQRDWSLLDAAGDAARARADSA